MENQHSIYRICRKQITSAKTRNTGELADYFQTRLPVAFLCTLLVLVILQLWCWTYLHFQILKAQEMSTSVPKKWSFFFFFFFLYDFVSYISLSFSQFAISSRSPKKGSWWPTIKRWNYTDVDSSIWNTHTGRILSNSSVSFYSFKNKEPHFYRLLLRVNVCNRPKVASLKCVKVYKLFYKPLRLKKKCSHFFQWNITLQT